MIFGIEQGALVMKLVEGATLDERIAQGRIPIEEALILARQIAAALGAAHEKGIVDRDLKPANIQADARWESQGARLRSRQSARHTIEQRRSPRELWDSYNEATRAGAILGTVGYMSPEQARGKAADKRADIWSFGVVLFEMVTGGRLFAGDTISDTIASLLRQQPRL